MNRRFKTAFILGAGLGVRLRPLTEHCPKPLLSLGGRPIITYAMEHLMTVGVERFIVNTHHCPEVYKQVFPDGAWRSVPVTFRHEPLLLDTGGGLKNIEGLLRKDEAILCYNGDILTNLPLRNLITAHEQAGADATLALRSTGPLLNVSITESGEICDFRNTLGNPGARSCLFSGIYAVETSLLAGMKAGAVESIIPFLVRRIVEKPGSIRGVIIDDGQWNDVGSVEVYESLRRAMVLT